MDPIRAHHLGLTRRRFFGRAAGTVGGVTAAFDDVFGEAG